MSLLRKWKEAEEMARHSLTIDPHEALGMRDVAAKFSEPDRQRGRNLCAYSPHSRRMICCFLTLARYDMVIGTRGEIFVLGRDFKAALKAWETAAAATTNERQRFAAKADDSCPGWRCYQRTSGSRESARAIGGKTARASAGHSFTESIELGLPRA